MKKIMIALMCVFSCMFALANDANVTNVYNFKAILKVPYLNNGIRTYASQTLNGHLYAEIVEGRTESMWLELQNSKTKTIHLTQFNDGFYYLMGKSNKYSDRTVPTIYYEAADVSVDSTDSGHEFISKIQFAGTGSLKNVKTVTTGCAVCGETTKITKYCNVLYKMNGYATGVMDCLCPDEEYGWWHTVQTTLCGVLYDDNGNVERKHDAAVWGTWSATLNNKLSDTKIK